MALAPTEEPPVAEPLLAHLRDKLSAPGLIYAEEPEPVTGGFDNRIFSLRFIGAPAAMSGPLILRVFRPGNPWSTTDNARRARFETAVQNAVAELGYPAPRALYVWTAKEPLGEAFMIVERMPGRTLNDAMLSPNGTLFRSSTLIAEGHAALHTLDPGPVREAVVAEGLPEDVLSVAEWLGHLARITHDTGMHGLDEGLEWLRVNRPAETAAPVVCHGDFHPLNLLLGGGQISGVIDWPWARIAPAEYDVGATVAIMSHGPVDLPSFVAPVVDRMRSRLIRNYMQKYEARRPLNRRAVTYFEAMRTLGFLFEAGRQRLVDVGVIERPGKPTAFRERRQINGIGRRFLEITGIRVTLPPRAEA